LWAGKFAGRQQCRPAVASGRVSSDLMQLDADERTAAWRTDRSENHRTHALHGLHCLSSGFQTQSRRTDVFTKLYRHRDESWRKRRSRKRCFIQSRAFRNFSFSSNTEQTDIQTCGRNVMWNSW